MNLDIFPRIAGKLISDVVSRGDSGGAYVTFDDGPDPQSTLEILSVLAQEKCPATFFITGIQAERHPTVIEQIHQSGHTVGSHGYDHKSLVFQPASKVSDDIDRANEVISQTTGEHPRFFRPPYGRFGFTLLDVVRNHDMKVILWSLSGADWKLSGVEEIVQRIIKRIAPGDIILLHDRGAGTETTIKALPLLIDGIRNKGIEIKKLDNTL